MLCLGDRRPGALLMSATPHPMSQTPCLTPHVSQAMSHTPGFTPLDSHPWIHTPRPPHSSGRRRRPATAGARWWAAPIPLDPAATPPWRWRWRLPRWRRSRGSRIDSRRGPDSDRLGSTPGGDPRQPGPLHAPVSTPRPHRSPLPVRLAPDHHRVEGVE
jgi:hypothetical protein